MSKIITNESFLKSILGYTDPDVELLSNYINSSSKITCKCKICGHEWGMLPGNIKQGKGCPKCAPTKKVGKVRSSTAKEKLISYVKKNCSFDLISDYVNAKTTVKCKCKICGHEWTPLPGNILKGQGCPECSNKAKAKKLMISSDILKLLPNTIELLEDYKGVSIPTLLKCKTCGYEWYALLSSIIYKHRGCPICNKYIKTNEMFLEQMAEINPDIEILEPYINAITKLKCRCKNCGFIWYADPHHLLHKKGCPVCNKSKGEKLILNILLKYNVPFIYLYRLESDFSSKIFVDFMIEFNNFIYYIEYNGILHYQPIEHFGGKELFEKQKRRDTYLENYCYYNNIALIEVKYTLSEKEVESKICEYLCILHEDSELNNTADKLAVEASQEV